MNTDKTTVTASAPETRIDSVKIEWLSDSDPDLSWLDQTDSEMGEGFGKQSEIRKESYGRLWEMLGCVAKAEVSYPCGPNGERRIEWLTSGGCWGIESDHDKSYLQSIEADELSDLASHLNHFGFECNADDLKKLIQ